MLSKRIAVASLLATCIALSSSIPTSADDKGNFVVQLGQDTTSVESYTRTPNRVEVNQVGRAPRVLGRHFVYDFAKGRLTHFSMVVTPPGGPAPTQTIDATVDTDSFRLQTQSGTQPVQKSSLAWPAGTFLVAGSSPWTGYEAQIMKLVQGKPDSLVGNVYYLGSPGVAGVRLNKQADGTVKMANDRGDVFLARVDKQGRIQSVKPIAGTAKFSVTRVPALDVNAMAAAFAAREKAGAGLGTLSPRDTVEVANAGGATLWVDYGRPRKRGRIVFGEVVPFGEVWRTGANAATQFKTDKPLDFSGTVVPAGFYTLWTIPSPQGWKFIINSETGQWGTDHKPDKDLYTIEMKVTALPQAVEQFTISVDPTPQGGVLNFDWDTTRASAPFVVKQ